jgi:hypothetical protein
VGDECDAEHRADDADGREQAGRCERAAHRVERGVEPTVEQDERQRRGAQPERELVVVERDAAEPLRARDHPDREEDQSRRDAQPLRDVTHQRARGEQHRHHGEERGRGIWLVRDARRLERRALHHRHLVASDGGEAMISRSPRQLEP